MRLRSGKRREHRPCQRRRVQRHVYNYYVLLVFLPLPSPLSETFAVLLCQLTYFCSDFLPRTSFLLNFLSLFSCYLKSKSNRFFLVLRQEFLDHSLTFTFTAIVTAVMIAELVFAVIPLAASVGHLLLNGIDNYRKLKTLLRNGSDLEDLIKALKYLVDKFEGLTITDDVSKEYMDLYIRMKDKVIKLYHKINQMKDDYQKHPRHSSIRALFDDTSLTKDFRSALRAVEDFQIVQNFICHGIYPKPLY
ncbi:hypothetical protein BDW60DRAFT_191812 [Aspergillus nidulans var. acristatus]